MLGVPWSLGEHILKRFLTRLMMFCLLGLILNPAFAGDLRPPSRAPEGRPWRILHIMSYDVGLDWSNSQFAGFKLGLGRGIEVEYKVLELDTKRDDNPLAVAERVKQAENLIKTWAPDLLYASDDMAIEKLIHPRVNTSLPCVFSGMNRSVAYYGLTGAKNVTGVLEQEHFIETVRLLQQLRPGASRIQVISDQSAYWDESIQRIEALARSAGGISIVSTDRIERYTDFQRVILQNPKKADAYLLLGTFSFKNERGGDVQFKDVQQWIAENSHVPDISFWSDRIKHGTLVGVTVSALDQGHKAGDAARRILLEGRSPGSIAMEVTHKGIAMLNLARARALSITPRAGVLLSSVVETRYTWTKK